MRTAFLITLYAAWPLAVIVARLLAEVRARFLLVCAVTWVLAVLVGTIGRPTDKTLPLGLLIGAGCCLALVIAVQASSRFTWLQNKTWFPDEVKVLLAETCVVFVVTLVGASAAVLVILG